MDPLQPSSLLCDICCTLHRITVNYHKLDFGTIKELRKRQACPVCLLVLRMLRPEPNLTSDSKTRITFSSQMIRLKKLGRDGFSIWQNGRIQGDLNFLPDKVDAHSSWWSPLESNISNVSSSIDFNKLKTWIAECDSDHPQCTATHAAGSVETPVRTFFIDTIANRLVYKDTNIEYLALSYVWGNEVMFKTTSTNCDSLQQLGAFLDIKSSLNVIMKDAMEVTRQVGMRYLWIDAVCIRQDDETEMAELIARMDSIYAQAYLTIIASSAESANSLLPGVRKGTRLPSIASVNVSIKNAEEDLSLRFVTVRPSLVTVLRNSSYNSRGWTYQESCLSRRCLIFTDHETYFHCNSGLESDCSVVTTSDVWPERTILFSSMETQRNTLDLDHQFGLFTRLVSEFSKRKLTYSEDSLRAINGILMHFSSRFGWRFVAGMPSHMLSRALLWRSASPSPVRNPNFPSWSWAGWKNQSYWDSQDFIDPVWTQVPAKDPTMATLQSEIEVRQSSIEEALNRSGAENGLQGTAIQFSTESVQLSALRIITPRILNDDSYSVPLKPYEELWTRDGLRCGMLYDFQLEKERHYKFIALSRYSWETKSMLRAGRLYDDKFIPWFGHVCDDEKLTFSEFCLVNVMLVVIEGSRAERAGIGLIHKDVWKRIAKSRENINLC